MTQLLRMFLVSALTAAGLAFASGAPAQAANTDYFFLCVPNECDLSYTEGSITWHNRTATVTGKVVDIGRGHTTAQFWAYDDNTQVGDDQTRSANDDSSLGKERSFSFTLGDTNRIGGFNITYIQVCWNDTDGLSYCSGVGEYRK